ncbi:ABC transporter substrate-binding protein [uncultured Cohaesibacter sp.]|uniref:ABC transporter substrate-binding protein n=1 Tax=uncultured Cohaesibacter sp. TaxID=1002546 RepID=UPI00292CFC48|nr:ABC transporter substrate-binding protein [uncultured Cohaesibacter sp.]
MKFMKTGLAMAMCAFMGLAGSQAVAADAKIPNNLRIVIGSKSTGGDTYQNSAIVAQAMAEKLGINVKVDAVGASAAFKTLRRMSNGSTIMIFHDQSYLGFLYGVKGYFNIFEDFTVGPTVAINPGNAYLVPKSSPYKTLEDIIQACANDAKIRVAIQPGGVSEIGYSALKNAIKLRYPGKEGNLVAVNTGSQADKNQLLFDGQADLIQGSVQSNEQYTQLPAEDQKAMRFVWLTAREETIKQTKAEGMGATTQADLLEYVSPKVSVTLDGEKDFTFDKEFFFLYNKKMDPALVEALDKALAEIYGEGKIQETQKNSFFIPNFKPSAEAADYLKAKMDRYEVIIDSIR